MSTRHIRKSTIWFTAVFLCLVLQTAESNKSGGLNRKTAIPNYTGVVKKKRTLFQKGLECINRYRKQMKISAMQLDPAFCMAAQAHADYLSQNKLRMSHHQKAGLPGYFGREFQNRVKFFNGKGPSFECIGSQTDPVKAVDSLMGSVYHRLPFQNPDNNRVGLGVSSSGTVIDFGRGPKYQGKEPILYPGKRQQNVIPFWWVNESPNPVAQFGSPKMVGYPVSVRFHDKIQFVSATLSSKKEKNVPAYILHPGNDKTKFLKQEVFLLSKEPLKKSTVYTVRVFVKIKKKTLNVQWMFDTSSASPPAYLMKRWKGR